MMGFLAALTGIDVEALRTLTVILGLITGACSATSAVHGFLNRRLRKAAKSDAEQTLALVAQLAAAFGIAKPEEITRIATDAAHAAVDEKLAPVHQFFAAVELVEHRREHRPETDIIHILEKEKAAA